ncbi:P-loop containing nucleoside triphosphate hydrolase protein [Russula compacta]|nr:P-loop containing nucleoside triphosphate hydrolase protein [Russula compacta]
MNILKPNSIQRASLLALLSPGDPPSWRDAFIKSQTGSGRHFTIIIAPARELAKQISDVLEVLLKLRLRPLDAAPDDEENNSGATRGHENARLRKGIPILVATPGRLLDDLQSTSPFGVIKCRWLVHDEADRLMELGFVDRSKGSLRVWREAESSQYRRSRCYRGSAVSGGNQSSPHRRICYRNTSLCHSNYVWSHLLPYFNLTFATWWPRELQSYCVPQLHRLGGFPLASIGGSNLEDDGDSRSCGISFALHEPCGRGLDLPLVRAVEQYDLSTEGGATEYIHRVGRTARAGRGRQAWTIIAPSEEQWVEWVQTRIASEAAEGGAGHFVAVAVEEILRAGFGGQGREYKDHATEVQLAFERWCLQRKENVEMARKAFASHLRAYATHPLDDKQMFHVRHLHLGHLANAMMSGHGGRSRSTAAGARRQARSRPRPRRRGHGGESDGAVAENPDAVRRMQVAVCKQGRLVKKSGAMVSSGLSEFQVALVSGDALERLIHNNRA